MIRKLFKLIFTLIIIAVLIVGAVVGTVIYAISDSTDEAPIEKYDATITTNKLLTGVIADSMDKMGTNYSIDLLFDEDSLNNLLFSYVRKSINEEYDPKNGTSSKSKYAFSIDLPQELPLVGGKSVGVKSLYGKINGENVTINITGDVADMLKTRLFFTFKVQTLENDYVLKIEEMQIGKIKLINGMISDFALDTIKTSVDINKEVNNKFKEINLPFVFDINNFTLKVSKQDFSDWVSKQFSGSEEENMQKELLNVLFDPKNDMLKFGMFDKLFGVQINLEALRVDESKVVLSDAVKEEFNAELMIKNKAQTMVMSSLGNPAADKFITFTDTDMSRLIYTNTEGYKDFKIESEIMEGVKFNFSVDGIVFGISDDGKELEIKLILNINGLKTTVVLNGETIQVDEKNVKIKLGDVITIGKDINIGSKFMTDMLANNFTSNEMMKYDKTDNSLGFSAEVFNTFIKESMDSSSTPLEVSKLSFDKNCLKIYVSYTDSGLASAIDTVTTLINDTLEAGLSLDTSKFNEADAEKVAEVQESLNDVSEKLTNGTLTAEDTEALVSAVNGLSTEAQEEFFSQIADNVSNPSDLEDLYSKMFGSGE